MIHKAEEGFTQAAVSKELENAIPNIKKRLGVKCFELMCKTMALIINSHVDLTPKFLRMSIEANRKVIERFYEDKKKEFPNAKKVDIYIAVLAAVMVGNIYNIDPLRLLVLIPRESGYNPNAMRKNKDGSTDIGIYQINSKGNPKKTYDKHPKYELRRFNSTIKRLGGFSLKKFPCNILSYNIFENTVGAALTLIEKKGYLKTWDWRKIYTLYNGSLTDPRAIRYGSKMEAEYEKEKYHFVLVKDVLVKKQMVDEQKEILSMIPKRVSY